jgi:large subunit ribosomal protein L19e
MVDHEHTRRTSRLTRSFSPLQIQKAKAERARDRVLREEMDAKRAKNKALRERRLERKEAKRDALINETQE